MFADRLAEIIQTAVKRPAAVAEAAVGRSRPASLTAGKLLLRIDLQDGGLRPWSSAALPRRHRVGAARPPSRLGHHRHPAERSDSRIRLGGQ
jgi:hypothetical protein